jgi:ankyrin repeat protein
LLGDLAAVERLLQARAYPDAVPTGDEEGKTPLLYAAKEGHTDIARLLLKYEANANAQNQVCACIKALMRL